MRALKFLRSGAIDPYAGIRWPRPNRGDPGPWVSPADAVPPLNDGAHGLRARDLAYWVNDELWEIELAEPVLEGEREVVGTRGRLLQRVGTWTPELARAFAAACVDRARVHAQGAGSALVAEYATDAQSSADNVAVAAYVAAHAAGHAAAAGGAAYEPANAAEREWQSAWLAERLELGRLSRASSPGMP